MFKSETKLSLFPTNIWFWDVDDGTKLTIEQALNAKLSHVLEAAKSRPAVDSVQSSANLHRLKEFVELVAAIHLASELVIAKLSLQVDNLKISGCWANINPPRTCHLAHHHANNLLSGVYYISTPTCADTIVFNDPRPGAQIIIPRIKSGNEGTPHSISLKVVPGRLVVFPAWLEHLVPMNKGDGLRISIAFNVIDGDFVESCSPPQWDGIPVLE